MLTARSSDTLSFATTQVVEKRSAKAVQSSTAFFSRLQDEVKSHIKVRASDGSPGQKGVMSAKKLKL
jgi:hypothetical protein